MPIQALSQPRALAFLAYLSAAGHDGCTRDKLTATLWPELDASHARHALSVLLHQVRRTLGRDAVAAQGESLTINDNVLAVDTTAFDDAVRRGDLAHAVALFRGPFLDGLYITGSAEFDRWVDDERLRFDIEYLRVLETLATAADRDRRLAEAERWWHRAAQHDPFNSRVALCYARALAAVGDRGNGVQYLQEHVRRLREELAIEPDDEILDAIRTGHFGVVPDYTNGSGITGARGTAPVPASDEVLAEPTLHTSGRPRSWRRFTTAGIAAVTLAFTGALTLRSVTAIDAPSDTVAVLPTQTLGLDASVAPLITSYLHSCLAEWPAFKAVGDEASHPAESATRTGVRLNAELALTSHAVPVAEGVELQAALVRTSDDATIATAAVSGPSDSLRQLTERLIVHLIGRAEGIEEHELTAMRGHDPNATRLFVMSRRAEPDERRRLLREALDHDSTFALAAMVLLDDVAFTAGRMREAPWQSVARTAWVHRHRLNPGDRAYVEALVEWQFIPEYSADQLIQAWERAVEIAPDRRRNVRGLALACYRWCSQLSVNWHAQVLEVHDRLVDLGDVDPMFLEFGMEVAYLADDTARMRRYAALLPSDAVYGQWLAAARFGSLPDSAEFATMVREHGFLGVRVGNLATLTGMGLEFGAAAAGVERTSGRVHQLIGQVSARTRGRHAEYRRLRDKMFQLEHTMTAAEVFLYHLIVWEWAYFGEPETDSLLDHVDRGLQSLVERGPVLGSDTVATAYCALAQLRLGRGDTTGVREAMTYLTTDPDARRLAVSRLCSPFLELLAVRHANGDRGAISQVTRRLDDVLQARPLDIGTGSGMYNVEVMLAAAANLVLAQSLFELGYPESAFWAVIRRPYTPGKWDVFGFHVDFLREEARFRAATGATEEALERYERYFQFRPEPPDVASWREDWYAVKAEYETLRSLVGA